MSIAESIRGVRATIVAAAVVAAAVAGLVLATRPQVATGPLVALVHDGDGHTHELPLDQDTQLTVTTRLGTNVIEVRDGAVLMADADCPNGTCLAARPLSEPGGQIICLPHQLWVEVVPMGSEGSELDVTRADGAGNAAEDLQAR